MMGKIRFAGLFSQTDDGAKGKVTLKVKPLNKIILYTNIIMKSIENLKKNNY